MDGIALLKSESLPIREAARTISLAFSNDPLICWLRPHGQPWAELDDASLKWQRRRVQQSIHENTVLYSIPAKSKTLGKTLDISERSIAVDDTETKYGAVAILRIPQWKPRWKWSRLLSWLRLRFLELVDPVQDPGADADRIEVMMTSHWSGVAEIKQKVFPRQLWYIEVIAVRPSLHGQGFGGDLLQSIIEFSKGDPIVLECTDRKTLRFYQRYGFELVREVELKAKDSDDSVTVFLMLRQ